MFSCRIRCKSYFLILPLCARLALETSCFRNCGSVGRKVSTSLMPPPFDCSLPRALLCSEIMLRVVLAIGTKDPTHGELASRAIRTTPRFTEKVSHPSSNTFHTRQNDPSNKTKNRLLYIRRGLTPRELERAGSLDSFYSIG